MVRAVQRVRKSKGQNGNFSCNKKFNLLSLQMLVNPAANVNAPLAKADELHEKRKCIAAKIAEEWTCLTHSQPDKPILCWRTRSHEEILTGPCYPITVSNINMWTGLVVRLVMHLKYITS